MQGARPPVEDQDMQAIWDGFVQCSGFCGYRWQSTAKIALRWQKRVVTFARRHEDTRRHEEASGRHQASGRQQGFKASRLHVFRGKSPGIANTLKNCQDFDLVQRS
ncbi:unnamed protein product [Durusdinium trenchii]|uniref:Uncharacterized protein n=1 Tax=Durusdinium trenchii TaxID=1381693 RepID=A0ABP0NJQ8_9DINO